MANESQAGVIAAKIRVPPAAGLPRERLEARLASLWEHRFGLVVGPAGSGKTTLLSQFAAAAGVPTGWYRAEQADGSEVAVLRHLRHALRPVVGEGPAWERVEDACNALDRLRDSRALVVVDDFHVLRGTPAEAVVERLVDYCPPGVVFLLASRVLPDFNLPRFRVSGALLELGADDLRFRSWEVEHLFRDVYNQPLPPEDLARLTHETGGWAAVLQLFHLATKGKPPHESRRMLGALRNHSRLVRDYLTRNVLDELPAALRDFLVETCVLGRLSGSLCDQLRGATGSAEMLDELARRQVFVQVLDDDGSYRYHDVLNGFLEATLLLQVGEAAARARYRKAGELLEADQALSDALRAYARAEAWPAVARLLGRDGEGATQSLGSSIELLPPTLVEQDGWLTLALARRHRATGAWQEAMAAYRRAEVIFGSSAASQTCQNERQVVTTWLDPSASGPATWWGVIRSAVTRDPLQAVHESAAMQGANARFAQGIASLLAGRVFDARISLGAALHASDASPVLEAGSTLALAVVALLAGDESYADLIDSCVEQAERVDAPWLAMVAQSLRVDGATIGGDASDEWGSCLSILLGGIASIGRGVPATGALETAAKGFERLGAHTLEAWSRSAFALASAYEGSPNARDLALEADALARMVGAVGSRVFALSATHPQLAQTIAAECGIAVAALADAAPDNAVNEIECFGGFRLAVDRVPIDLTALRPRARSLLKLLALHAGKWVHREVLVEALWPEAAGDAGVKNLHVAVSSLRHVLGTGLIEREGEAYRLGVKATDSFDLAEFGRAVAAVSTAADADDSESCLSALDRLTDLYRGDLLPEEGPAEWVIEERDRCRFAAVDAVGRAAACALRAGDSERAAKLCRRGLAMDRYADPLWRTLLLALNASGDDAGAAVARDQYRDLLTELGVDG